eukprot:SAG11_NODE_803_length_7098_cov_10.219174_7_plen_585_part_00
MYPSQPAPHPSPTWQTYKTLRETFAQKMSREMDQCGAIAGNSPSRATAHRGLPDVASSCAITDQCVNMKAQGLGYDMSVQALYTQQWFACVHIWSWRSEPTLLHGRSESDTYSPCGKTAAAVVCKWFTVMTKTDDVLPERYASAARRHRVGENVQVLNVLDFGAKGDGLFDCAPAIQRAIDRAQAENRKVLVPAGIYRINHGLVVNTTQHSAGKYSPSTQHFKIAPLHLFGDGANNGGKLTKSSFPPHFFFAAILLTMVTVLTTGGQSVIFAGRPMGAVLTYASRQPGSLGQDDAGISTTGHVLEQITLDANDLANFSSYAPAVWGSQWRSVSFIHGLVAGLYIGYGWIHNIENCAFKNNGVVNLYLDRAVNSVNIIDNNFAASPGVGIVLNNGEAVRIVGNCFQSLGGPAIYANQIGALTISGSYYEANNQRTTNFTWTGADAPAVGTLCAEIVLNGAGNRTSGRWSAIEWSTNPVRLAALVTKEKSTSEPRYAMAPQPLLSGSWVGSAIIEGSYHNPDQSACSSNQYFGVFVAGGKGVSVRNNDCRACSKRHSTRRCSMVGGSNVSDVEQHRNTGDWGPTMS